MALQVPAEVLTRGLGATESAGVVTVRWERATTSSGLARGRRGSARGLERDGLPGQPAGEVRQAESKTALARPFASTGSTPALTA